MTIQDLKELVAINIALEGKYNTIVEQIIKDLDFEDSSLFEVIKRTITFKSTLKKIVLKAPNGYVLKEFTSNSSKEIFKIPLYTLSLYSPEVIVELYPKNITHFQRTYETDEGFLSQKMLLNRYSTLELTIISGSINQAKNIIINKSLTYPITEISLSTNTGNNTIYETVNFFMKDTVPMIEHQFEGSIDSFEGKCHLSVLPKGKSQFRVIEIFNKDSIYDNVKVNLTYKPESKSNGVDLEFPFSLDYRLKGLQLISATNPRESDYTNIELSKDEIEVSFEHIFHGSQYSFKGECKLIGIPEDPRKHNTPIELTSLTKNSIHDNVLVKLLMYYSPDSDAIYPFDEVVDDYKPQNVHELYIKYNNLLTRINTLEKNFKLFIDKESKKIETIGLAYSNAYHDFNDAITQSQQAQEEINAFWSSVFSIASSALLISTISTWVEYGNLVKKLTIKYEDEAKAIFNVSEDVVQTAIDKWLTTDTSSKITKTRNKDFYPDQFKSNIVLKLLDSEIAISQMIVYISDTIAEYQEKEIGGTFLTEPQQFNQENEYIKYQYLLKQLNSFISLLSKFMAKELADIDKDELKNTYEKGMWAKWLPKLKISKEIDVYNPGTQTSSRRTSISYTTELGSSKSGIIGAMRRLEILSKLNIEMSDSFLEEWGSEVQKLVEWAESYNIKPL